MNRILASVVSGLLSSFIAIPSHAQCKDQLCFNLQKILDAALIDYREYRRNPQAEPDVSTATTKIPCQMNTWANNVPMYICYAQVPYANAADWYAKTIDDLKTLSPSDWHFKINSPGDNHFVDAGPPNCEVAPTEGPYIGQCPLHLAVTKESDGSAKVYLWINSLTSPYLLKHAAVASPKPAPPATVSGCDDLCQSLKKAFESRIGEFANIRADSSQQGSSGATVTLSGAKECAVGPTSKPHDSDAGTQFVCYWRETSASAANARFTDLISRLQVLIPTDWSSRKETEPDELTGNDLTLWQAADPSGKYDVRVYLADESLGLHITSWH